ncbi:PIN domain-containing protein [Halococcus sp. AFM35]|uniref:PIN domain-containing protein n=1 Tax=Halococcus sp. AFM35 TaxID=3421653 RepID=UPI003EBE0B8C
MKVLDTSFLIDYGNGVDAAGEYLRTNEDDVFVIPAPVYTEYLLGTVHSDADTDIAAARQELAWGEVAAVTEEMAVVAAAIADEIGPQGPNLAAVDALVAAVGREFGAPVVSGDSDLTHAETRKAIRTETY